MKKLITIFGIAVSVISHGQNNCQMTGWQYVKVITIDNSTNTDTLTGFQININIDTQTPIAQGKMKNNASDIRFVSSSCDTLKYWIEKGINTTSTIVWVKLNSIQGSAVDSIYMYYGNLLALSASNGDSTFIAFDDFDDGVISSVWQIESANWSESGGILISSGNSSFDYPIIKRGGLNITSGFYVHYNFRWTSAPGAAAGGWHSMGLYNNPNSYMNSQMRNTNEYYFEKINPTSTNHIIGSWPHNTNWHEHEFYKDQNGQWDVLLNNTSKGTPINNDILNIDTLKFRGPSDGWGFFASIEIDSLFITKYTSPFPSFTTSNELIYSYSQDTCDVYDTTFVTVYDTIDVFDTTFVTVYDTTQVYDTTFVTITDTVTVYDTIAVFDTTFVTVTDTVTVYDSIAITDTLIIDVALGLPPPNDINTIKVYPNPAADMLTIDNGNFALMNNYRIEITDNIGVQVFFSVINQQTFTVDISQWATGLYFIHIKDAGNQIIDTRKIVLQ